jgi:hypothetical protein
VEELDDMYRTRRAAFNAAVHDLAGDYAYTLGYLDGDALHGLCRDSGDDLPIMADRPGAAAAGNSLNHGGAGQNVLYIGGQVLWRLDRGAGVQRDDIYLNKGYQPLAGRHRLDTVLGASDATPYPPAD